MKNEPVVIKAEGLSKQYRLGAIGSTTLRDELQRMAARIKHREDPTAIIGSAAAAQKRGDLFYALKDVSFEVKRGESLGVIGRNGAGKSTLLKLISRITAPTEGVISYDGKITSMLEVGTGFHPELTGRENIYMNGAILGMTKKEIDKKVDEIIDFSEVGQFIDTPVKRYSSGMYVKLAFSVASHLDSEIMIMDEVLAVGDMSFQKKCLARMRELAHSQGKTILYVSHNMNTIRGLCDRCIVLYQGKLIYDGDVNTAIGYYMNTSEKAQLHYVYDGLHATWAKDDFVIRSMDVLKESPVFGTNEIIPLRFNISTKKPFENVYFRFEIHSSAGATLGTEFTSNSTDLPTGADLHVTVNADFSHLAPGRYSSDIIAYTKNEYGAELHIDGVYPGMFIEIDDRTADGSDVNWNHFSWGSIRLNDAEII